jgi:diguanylate cyclase (GGDEF)-like protein
MYLPYLMLGYSAAILLGLVGCRIAARVLPGLPGVRLLSWGLASVFAGMVLFALRPVTPLWVTSVLANETILLYYVLLYAALAQILGLSSRVAWWGTGLLLAELAANFYFSYGYPSLPSRFIVTSLFPAVCSVAAATLLFRRLASPENALPRRAARRQLVEAMAWLQAIAAASAGVRSVLTVLYPPRQVMELDLVQSAFTYLNLLYGLSSAACVLWLAFLIHREDLYTRANTDGLTGLLNRRAFDEVLARELLRADAEARSISVIMADIDFFKRVNDVWGHPAGDEVIRAVGYSLRRVLRPSDPLARFGGEEFAIVLRESSLSQATEVAERLRAGVVALSRLPGGLRVTISLGLAASIPGEKPDELIHRCDQALYRSKREGRNRVSIAADPKTGEQAAAPPSPHLVQKSETQRSA